jgi:hypothetical protein
MDIGAPRQKNSGDALVTGKETIHPPQNVGDGFKKCPSELPAASGARHAVLPAGRPVA